MLFKKCKDFQKKENKICYVLKSIVQVEQIPKITKLIEECENFFIPSKSFKRNAMKNKLKIGDKVIFNTGNYAGLSGVITEVDYNSGIYGVKYTVKLSNGEVGYIEKSEHWHFI